MFCREADRVILTTCQEKGAHLDTFHAISQKLGNKTASEVRGAVGELPAPRVGQGLGTWWVLSHQAPKLQFDEKSSQLQIKTKKIKTSTKLCSVLVVPKILGPSDEVTIDI